jgi:choline dehydrogenase-like flavoprotein
MTVDTLIIGSGVVAAAISQRLLEKNPRASILVLEAGGRVKTKDFALWEQYLITGRLPYEVCRDLDYPQRDVPGENASLGTTPIPLIGARLFVYGGSTMHWGGWSFRLKPEDFCLSSNTKTTQSPGEGANWPLDYDALETYYLQAENYLAVSGDSSDHTVPRKGDYPFRPFPFTLQDQPLIGALQKLNYGYGNVPIARRGVSPVPSHHAPCQTTGTCKYCPFGARYVAGDYIDDVQEWNDYPNFEIKLGCVVEKITSRSKRQAGGVDYMDKASGQLVSIEAKTIIVAGGTIESAKLLQRSTSTYWPNGIGNGNDLVGRYFITHPYFIFSGFIPSNTLKLQPEMNFPTLVSRHFDSEAEQTKGKFVLVNPPDTVPVALAAKMQAGFSRSEIDTYVAGRLPLQLHGMVEVFGRHENRIQNLARKNRVGLPQTSVDFSADAAFRSRMSDIKTEVQKIYAAMGAELTDDASVSWRADHAASTCRMSDDASSGVVNKNLQVHDMDNLFVCSNAVFPNLGAVNPTLTLTALALRLADFLGDAGTK